MPGKIYRYLADTRDRRRDPRYSRRSSVVKCRVSALIYRFLAPSPFAC